jgi:DNA-binding NarL/FixJ family response regulator
MAQGDRPTGQVALLVVEDHDLVAETLRRALDAEDDFTVVGVVGSVERAVTAAQELRPDVVVMDYGLPDGSGVDATIRIKADRPDIEVVMLTGDASGATLGEALEAGCSGFVAKEGLFADLVQAIRAVMSGEVRIPPALMQDLAVSLRPQAATLGSDLTDREREILQLLAAGHSTDAIVGELVLSVHTVRNHIGNILMKLDARSRLEAVAVATRLGIVEPPSA